MSIVNTVDHEHAIRFKSKSVVERYGFRPPYDQEIMDFLIEKIPEHAKSVLDAGSGPGKIARLLTGKADRIDAVDFSEEMIRLGRTLPSGDNPKICWIHAKIEEALLNPPYGLIVIGASLHWMDLNLVFQKFKDALHPTGSLVIMDGDGPCNVPWGKFRNDLIAEYSTYKDYVPFDALKALENSGCFKLTGNRTMGPYNFNQSLDQFINAEHSRASLSVEGMGKIKEKEFDHKMEKILLPFVEDGLLRYQVKTQVLWGKPCLDETQK